MSPSEQPSHERITDARGILSLLSPEPLIHIFSARNRIGAAHRRRHENDFEQASTVNVEVYVPSESDLTLLYFCDSTCRNSLRFAQILTQFVQICNEVDVQRKPMQLICIPNDESPRPTRLYDGPFSQLCDFWHIGFDYKNRLALIRLLSINKVPTLVVISNDKGTMVTNKGMEVVELYDRSQYETVLSAWKNGISGLTTLGTITSTCAIT